MSTKLIDFKQTTELKHVKMFLGNFDGIQRYDRYNYQIADKLYRVMESATWFPREISFARDKVAAKSLSPSYLELYTANLLFQTLADSLANRFLDNVLSGHLTSPEWEAVVKMQAHQELNHSISYSHNIREVFTDPSLFFDDGFQNKFIQARLNFEIDGYAQMENDLAPKWSDFMFPCQARERKSKAILSSLLHQLALEALRFMVSFLYTFKVNALHDQSLQGSTNNIKLILNDELVHVVIMTNMISILQKVEAEGFTDIASSKWFEEKAVQIFESVIKSEMKWFEYLSNIQHINGFTEKNIREFLESLAYNTLKGINITKDEWNNPENDITAFFNKNKKINGTKSLAQETDLLSYNIGVLSDAGFEKNSVILDDEEIDFLLSKGE